MSDEEMRGLPLEQEEINTAEDDAPPPVWYVSYNGSGALTGYYFQVVHPDHEAAHIVLDEPLPQSWVMYRANADRTGVELVPADAPPQMSVEELAAQFSLEVQDEINRRARQMGYDGILTAVTYADEPAVARFQREGRALRRWRSLVWDHCQTLLAQVQAGAIEAPSITDVIAGLPALVVDEPETPAA